MTAEDLEGLWQKAVVAFLLDRLEHEGPAKLLDFSFAAEDPGRAAKVRVARLLLRCEDGSVLTISGSLGLVGYPSSLTDSTRHVFLGLYDSGSDALSELVAASHHFDRFVTTLSVGDTFPLGPKSKLRRLGYAGALILGGELYRPFKGAPASIAGIPIELFSVHPLTEDELMAKRQGGLEELLARWKAQRKDYLAIRR